MERRRGDRGDDEALIFGEGNAVLVEVTEINEIGERKVMAGAGAAECSKGVLDCRLQSAESVTCGVLEQTFYLGFGERWEIDSWNSDPGSDGERGRRDEPRGAGPAGDGEYSDAMLWGTA